MTSENISHWNIWFTDTLLDCMTNYPNEIINSLFKPYNTYSGMSKLYGLSNRYLLDKRRPRWARKAIAISILEKMKDSISNKLEHWRTLYPDFIKDFDAIEGKILEIIRCYQAKFSPKPKPFSWLINYHPNLNINYFSEIKTLNQAYWLGYLIADGWITLIKKPHGDYYRVGFCQAQRDNESVYKFVQALGLNIKYVKNLKKECSFVKSRKNSTITMITFYSGNVTEKKNIANDLINLGMKYKFDAKKNMRKKEPVLIDLKNQQLMLAYLLGLYDGDGTLAFNKKDSKISPSIASSNLEFLKQIKHYFSLSYDIQKFTNVKYDYKRNRDVIGDCFKLSLGLELFKQMMSLKIDSLKRKRINIDLILKPKLTRQRKWLAEKFTELEMDSLLNVVSPTKISILLGIHRSTLVSFAKNIYHLDVPNGKYYNQLARSLQFRGKLVSFYSDFVYWTRKLEEIGKHSKVLK
ncbi:MAG: LAGLIDADG family homing endonuclease [Candidatus Hermodarchaeota archaeon]